MTKNKNAKPDVVALAKVHLLAKYAWAAELIASAEGDDARAKAKALAEIRKWLRYADVLPTPTRRGPSSEYLAERHAEMAAEDYIGGFCD